MNEKVKTILKVAGAIVGGVAATYYAMAGSDLVGNGCCTVTPEKADYWTNKEASTRAKRAVLTSMIEAVKSDTTMTSADKSKQLDAIMKKLDWL